MSELKDFDPIAMNFWVRPDPICKDTQQGFYRHVLASLEKHIRFILDKGITSVDEASLLKLLFTEYRLVNQEYELGG